MDVKLQNGDVLLNCAGEETYVEGIEEIFQQVLLCISTSKGSFIFDKEFGLRELPTEEDERSLKNAEALLNEAIIDIKDAEIQLLGLERTSVGVALTFNLAFRGETITREVTI